MALALALALFACSDAGTDGADRAEVGIGGVGDNQGDGRLAGSRRAPEDHRRYPTALDTCPENVPFTYEVLLTDEAIEASRPHPGGQRRVTAVCFLGLLVKHISHGHASSASRR